MKRLIAAAMGEGAMGLSTALLQPPSSFATTANLIELARTAKQYGGIYSSHIRDEGEGVFRAIDEAIQVGKGAGIPVDIIHMKIAHKKLWGRANEIDGEGARRGARHPRQRTATPQARTICPRSCRRGRTTAAARSCSSGSRIRQRGSGCATRS